MEKVMRLALVLGLATITSVARAQPADAQEEARTHFKAATELYDENNFRGALTEFKRAYELSPSYKLLFNIGQVEMELQDYAEALKAYSRYLREGGSDVPADRVTQLNAEVERLKGRVGYIIAQATAGAEIVIDNTSIGYAPLPEPVAVNTGRHEITVRAAGRDPLTRVVDVAGKQQLTVVLELAPSSRPGGGGAIQHGDRVTHPFNSKLLIGAGGVAFVGGVTLGIVELAKVPSNCSVSSNHCLGGPGDPSLKTAGDAVRMSNIGWVIGGVGLAAVVGGVIWYVNGKTVEKDPAFSLSAVPWVSPDGAGIAFSGHL